MQIEPEVAYRNVNPTPAIENEILQGIESLEKAHPRITGCRIMVEVPHPRHTHGNLYRVRIDLTIPGREVVVSRDPPARRTREEPLRAIREAFELARMKLRERREKQTGRPRVAEAPLRGRVLSLGRIEGYGFIRPLEGGEIYFHRTGVPGDHFEELEVGSEVRFVEEEVEGELRAVSVVPLDRAVRLLPGVGEETRAPLEEGG
jgi:cold shock CspA family protein/ribosome-associated translation inhibitor RaiA